jgi:hypothetical protein
MIFLEIGSESKTGLRIILLKLKYYDFKISYQQKV